MHQVIQVIPNNDFTVYIYFADGKIKIYDVKPLLGKGVFKNISDINVFTEGCTVLNNTLAWDIKGNYDPRNCIDLDPDVLYEEGIEVRDPLEKIS